MHQFLGKPINPLPRVNIDRGVTVKEKIEAIMNWLKRTQKFTFNELLATVESRTDVIVSFLALLDISKEQKATINQTNAFGDMEIIKI